MLYRNIAHNSHFYQTAIEYVTPSANIWVSTMIAHLLCIKFESLGIISYISGNSLSCFRMFPLRGMISLGENLKRGTSKAMHIYVCGWWSKTWMRKFKLFHKFSTEIESVLMHWNARRLYSCSSNAVPSGTIAWHTFSLFNMPTSFNCDQFFYRTPSPLW